VEPLRSTDSTLPADSIIEFLRQLDVFESTVVKTSEDVALDDAVVAGFDGLVSLLHETSNWKALLADERVTGEVRLFQAPLVACFAFSHRLLEQAKSFRRRLKGAVDKVLETHGWGDFTAKLTQFCHEVDGCPCLSVCLCWMSRFTGGKDVSV
jgi:hypothetical protein